MYSKTCCLCDIYYVAAIHISPWFKAWQFSIYLLLNYAQLFQIYDTLFLAKGLFWLCIIVKALSCLGFTLAFIAHEKDTQDLSDHPSAASLLHNVGDRLDKHEQESDDGL